MILSTVGHLSATTFDRPADLRDTKDPKVLYSRSYLLIRAVVGFIGILLPVAFIVGEAFLKGDVQVRGSVSAYYFTPMRDLFVGGLCVIGFLLVTYMAGQPRNLDNWLSTVAGGALLLVVAFPTSRPGLPDGAVRCGPGVLPEPAGCSPIQTALGEVVVATVHFASAGIFILVLAAMCFVFAWRDANFDHSVARARFHRGCAIAILTAVAWVGVGRALKAEPFGLTPLYVGEVVSVWAFGWSWIVKGKDILDLIKDRLRGERADGPEPVRTSDARVSPDRATHE